MNKNLEIYNQVRKVPQEAQKAFNNGSFSGTDINPMWRIQMLTELFGPAGTGWYFKVTEHWNEVIANEIHTHVMIELYVKQGDGWSQPIVGLGGNKSLQQFKSGQKLSDEGYKMALTDALSVACKSLGIGADVYFANAKTKYTENWSEEPAPLVIEQPKEKPSNEQVLDMMANDKTRRVEEAIQKMKDATTQKDLQDIRNTYADVAGEVKFIKGIFKRSKQLPQ